MSWKPAVAGVALLLAAAATTGCVERKMVVRSDPEGARLLLELDEIEGRTPVEVPFQYAGVREVVLIKPGYKVLETTATVENRWHSYFPLDFFAEILWPGTIHDVQEFHFKLEPYDDYDESQDAENERRVEELRKRAEAHRRGGSKGPGGVADVPERPVPLPPPVEQDAPPPPPPRVGR